MSSGRHFLQIPGPSNVPDRVLRAIDMPTMDHRGPDFMVMTKDIIQNLKNVFKTTSEVIIYPASGTGAWEAAMVNTLSAGDKVIMFETGQFAMLWQSLAEKLGLNAELLPGDWRGPADLEAIEAALKADTSHEIKAVCITHNETATGATSNIPGARKLLDDLGHPALLMVDAVSSLGSVDLRHDEWGIDVTIAGSQKGLMLPPGMSFNAVSEKALAAHKEATMPNAFWNWTPMITQMKDGSFPYTPATNLLYGLREAMNMLFEEGLDNVFARHIRYGEATRRAVQAWGLENQCLDSAGFSPVLTAVRVPDGHDANEVRAVILKNFDMSLGTGLGKVAGDVFRIGHLGDLSELSLSGTLCGVEMGLGLAGIPHQKGGVQQALAYLSETSNG
ncbi:MAG: aminotransferase class V-fold PLP-dependent enzyme [Rhodospirillaceae bacterium]|jgi:alanine-glyoxylate transaminase/serine-glyoxylate transaminase/serine-pyruvate transaminase|nr:aminotransferase class V-fold PLP-dependent enzyme [Rhodospirillaceae bacterium]MBT4700859.1 aminotransferase class V-fold PLP-dependent enzyme [Rhodospirillaceae bacterium]MBT5034535.1 aminotransferase class V-fold PLP-dependent enzyme [Rhodospirillaceae bacterium]MBT6221234.1 aminotransferase class V-fold PLP-dependent enzyme [Rhodospirillaceae bacterium]MBT6362307.1 aminotransferase class V-fold PLP-dependent enzyme [Rhodospirillaceae bacterium]